ncbi:MAG: preprotein translocase subunit SecE [Acholeplasmatales bacterium]|nr:preprotein translocase subunit SecE [Acholeplasmatales bacterium]
MADEKDKVVSDENLNDEATNESPENVEEKEEVVESKEKTKPEAEKVEESTDEDDTQKSLKREEDIKKKQEVEKKIKSQIEKKQEKEQKLGIFRIGEYLKEEHKWETWLFIVISVITLLLGCLILNHSLLVKDDFPVIGSHSKVFAWILVGASSLGLIYAVWPFFKPSFPEFKKVTWLTMPKFVGNCIRVFIFLIIFIGLFLMYDYLMVELFGLIF